MQNCRVDTQVGSSSLTMGSTPKPIHSMGISRQSTAMRTWRLLHLHNLLKCNCLWIVWTCMNHFIQLALVVGRAQPWRHGGYCTYIHYQLKCNRQWVELDIAKTNSFMGISRQSTAMRTWRLLHLHSLLKCNWLWIVWTYMNHFIQLALVVGRAQPWRHGGYCTYIHYQLKCNRQWVGFDVAKTNSFNGH